MKNLKPWIIIVLVFAAGVLVGVGGTRLAIRRVIERVTNNPSVLQGKIERDLGRELKLTPEQRSKVHEVLEKSQDDLKRLRAEFRPRLGQVLRHTEREIRTTLTAEQQARFDRLLKRRPIVPAALRNEGSATP